MDDITDHMHDTDTRFLASPSGAARFTIDEGFAEDSQNQLENNNASFDATAAHFQQWIQAQRPEVRAEVAYEVLRTLRTSQISAIVDRLTPLLHMDPLEKLPVEVTSMIFSYLDAKTLLTASLASHTWRERILDPRLWQELYRSEGWRVDMRVIRAFEAEHATLMRSEFKKARSQLRTSIGKGQPLFKRRATSNWLDSKPRRISADVATWREQHGIVEADIDGTDTGDQEMSDVGYSNSDSPSRPNKRQNHESGDEMDYSQETEPNQPREASSPVLYPNATLLIEDGQGDLRMNWPHLFKQRYKLEENWLKGRYTNFQLPHPNYPHEAHTECVYTIQFHGRWLVSGSRDKTLRVWDLDTRRLRGKPLIGHSQSVLCLQFDPTEAEDVIISGSSDSSVIVWKFSTGQKLHVIPSAHEESVLNLKFDRRYLVTCSKDKKIKIWNRHTLTPLDDDYPRLSSHSHARVPSYIIDTTDMDISLVEAKLANGQIKTLQPYMHLMTFEGHAAAVNAIQISGDLVVSASGDRLIRVWNVKNGVCLRVIPGHQKGIACVQFDDKRVVSGSSDNTVRVFDLITGVEVAVLLGHQNLVRTVQAGFGDTPGCEDDDLAAAKAAERACLEDLVKGRVVEDRQFLRRIRNGESGSSRVGVGSRLPPGGGGSKWGRIVSGSYDESIIIWKKDAKGQWIPGQTLRHDAGVRARIENDGIQQQPSSSRDGQTRARRRVDSNEQVANNNNLSASQIVQHAMNTSMSGLQTGIQNVMGITRSLNGNWQRGDPSEFGPSIHALNPGLQSVPVNSTGNHAQITTTNLIQSTTGRANVQIHTNLGTSTSHITQASDTSNRAQVSTSTQTTIPSQAQNTPAQPTQTTLPPPNAVIPVPGQNIPNQAPQNHQNNNINANTNINNVNNAANAANNAANNNNNQNTSVSRVFKLQFDARRIVCCSQDYRIIGWDFANNDPEIENASRFFMGP